MTFKMTHYAYQKDLEQAWKNAVDRYEAGDRTAESCVTDSEAAFLATIGLSKQEMFDYAEDYVRGGDPDFANVAAVTDVRRAYFLEVQEGKLSTTRVTSASLPAKTATINGIAWLPRIIAKARAKLAGELDEDTMYGCGGDRAFLKEHDIHPAEFLRLVWSHDSNDTIVAWVEQRAHQRVSQ